MKIAWEPMVYGGQVPVSCAICGDRAVPRRLRGSHYLLAIVYTQQGKVFGEACESCANASPHELRQLLDARIQALTGQLDELKALAAESDIETPSLEDEFNSFSWGAF